MTQLTIREAREKKRPVMTQEDLAAKSGVDQTYISLIERLLRAPSKDIKRRLAKALGIAPSRLRFAEPELSASVDRGSDRAGHTTKRVREAVA